MGILGNYAVFLKNILKDYDRAQELYERALKADPNHASILGNYAIFLTDIRKEHDRAQKIAMVGSWTVDTLTVSCL